MPKQKKNLAIDINALGSELKKASANIHESVQSAIPPAPKQDNKLRRGRKVSSIIKRENSICLYLEDRHKDMLEDVIFNNRIRNQQRIIQTALEEFFNKYYEGNELNEAGVMAIKAYDEKVTR